MRSRHCERDRDSLSGSTIQILTIMPASTATWAKLINSLIHSKECAKIASGKLWIGDPRKP